MHIEECGRRNARKHCALFYLFMEGEQKEAPDLAHRETCLVGFLSPSHKESVASEPVASDREAAVSLGERSSSSARQAGSQPRADQEAPRPPTCYRGALKGLRTAGFFWLLCAVNTQIVTDNSRSIRLQ